MGNSVNFAGFKVDESTPQSFATEKSVPFDAFLKKEIQTLKIAKFRSSLGPKIMAENNHVFSDEEIIAIIDYCDTHNVDFFLVFCSDGTNPTAGVDAKFAEMEEELKTKEFDKPQDYVDYMVAKLEELEPMIPEELREPGLAIFFLEILMHARRKSNQEATYFETILTQIFKSIPPRFHHLFHLLGLPIMKRTNMDDINDQCGIDYVFEFLNKERKNVPFLLLVSVFDNFVRNYRLGSSKLKKKEVHCVHGTKAVPLTTSFVLNKPFIAPHPLTESGKEVITNVGATTKPKEDLPLDRALKESSERTMPSIVKDVVRKGNTTGKQSYGVEHAVGTSSTPKNPSCDVTIAEEMYETYECNKLFLGKKHDEAIGVPVVHGGDAGMMGKVDIITTAGLMINPEFKQDYLPPSVVESSSTSSDTTKESSIPAGNLEICFEEVNTDSPESVVALIQILSRENVSEFLEFKSPGQLFGELTRFDVDTVSLPAGWHVSITIDSSPVAVSNLNDKSIMSLLQASKVENIPKKLGKLRSFVRKFVFGVRAKVVELGVLSVFSEEQRNEPYIQDLVRTILLIDLFHANGRVMKKLFLGPGGDNDGSHGPVYPLFISKWSPWGDHSPCAMDIDNCEFLFCFSLFYVYKINADHIC